MTEKEMWELDVWIALNVTKTLRRLSDSEYAAVVAMCDEANKEPHPNLMLTQPYRHEGRCAKCTADSADALEVLKVCGEAGILNGDFKLPVSIFRRGDLKWVVSENCEDEPEREFCIVVEAETLELAIALFAKKLFSK